MVCNFCHTWQVMAAFKVHSVVAETETKLSKTLLWAGGRAANSATVVPPLGFTKAAVTAAATIFASLFAVWYLIYSFSFWTLVTPLVISLNVSHHWVIFVLLKVAGFYGNEQAAG